jgi:hypothetical protein
MVEVTSANSTTALLATVHDPDGRMLAALDERGAKLEQYGGVFVTVTEATDARLRRRLEAFGATIVPGGDLRVGGAMRALLRAAMATELSSYFSCDFDRWLHWCGTFPRELDGVPARIAREFSGAWYVCIGRTERAVASHPEVQRVAEWATNRVLEIAAGRPLDATAGACWVSRRGAEVILAGSREETKATDLEWPALILDADPLRLGGLIVEGLEFETAEFYGSEASALGGIDAWVRATYQTPRMWQARLRLAADSAAALVRVLGR